MEPLMFGLALLAVILLPAAFLHWLLWRMIA